MQLVPYASRQRFSPEKLSPHTYVTNTARNGVSAPISPLETAAARDSWSAPLEELSRKDERPKRAATTARGKSGAAGGCAPEWPRLVAISHGHSTGQTRSGFNMRRGGRFSASSEIACAAAVAFVSFRPQFPLKAPPVSREPKLCRETSAGGNKLTWTYKGRVGYVDSFASGTTVSVFLVTFQALCK